jgi:hypothetical protein
LNIISRNQKLKFIKQKQRDIIIRIKFLELELEIKNTNKNKRVISSKSSQIIISIILIDLLYNKKQIQKFQIIIYIIDSQEEANKY